LRHGRKKLHAGKSGGGQQLRELLFSGCAFERYAIEQELRTRRAQKKPPFRSEGDRRAQLLPGDFQQFDSTRVPIAVQARELQQDVQASYESASGRCFWV
jgi:hypothetical protein